MDINIIVILAYIINFILIVAIVCFERRDPVVSLAWVLGFTILPVVGLAIFLVFGTGLKKHTKKKYTQKLLHDVKLCNLLQKQEAALYSKIVNEIPYSDITRYLLIENNSPYMENNDVKIFVDAEKKYESLLKDIENAKQTINMLYFIIRNDDISMKVLDLLTKKASEGVEVRFLYDDFGCLLTPRHIFKPLKKAGGRVVPFFPVKIGAYSKLNHRNHRKIVVIDGEIGYVGGMNIGDEYMGKKKLKPWRDTHLRITGTAVKSLQKYFVLDWEFSTDEKLSEDMDKFFKSPNENAGDVSMQIVGSGPDSKSEAVKCGMIKMLNDATEYAYIQTPYFVPDQAFMTALTIAAHSGVDVRVMLPGIPDKQYVYYVTKSYIGELLDAGIRVYLHKGFLHSKSMVIDDCVTTIGTTNIDIRSFQLHFEINAFIYGRKIGSECKNIFMNDLKDCVEMTRQEYDKRGIFHIFKEGLFRLFSPIM